MHSMRTYCDLCRLAYVADLAGRGSAGYGRDGDRGTGGTGRLSAGPSLPGLCLCPGATPLDPPETDRSEEDGRQRGHLGEPDLPVHRPGGRVVVVDVQR